VGVSREQGVCFELFTDLTCGVDDFGGEVLLLVADYFAEGVFDGWVVALDEVAIDVAHCQGGFA